MATNEKTIQKKETENIQKTERTRSGRVFTPATDIIETNNDIVLLADMPGLTKENIDVKLENNQLTIQGYVNPEIPKEYLLSYSEYDVGDYYRAFTLSDTIDQGKIEAEYKNGLLLLRLPKAEKAKSRQIAVNVD
ncbi:Hsp20/alpha crystallin family protein [candidate division KSB1 bacterium]|nr:Hsp20/alpha crystallin family protein [candidate division KSB1 bacterium]